MHLDLLSTPAPAWIQDLGRPGRLHEGMPPGGALVPERLVRANRAVGNPDGLATIEVFGTLVVAARGGDLLLGWNGTATVLPQDHVRTLTPTAAPAYLAVAGGLDVPEVLGGRGLLAVAGIGGGFGRPLRVGDRVAVGPTIDQGGRCGGGTPPPQGEADFDPTAPIRVLPGPDLDRFAPGAFEAFLAGSWVVGPGDRVGTRLRGPALARVDGDRAPSAPMVRGAVQVPAGGAPIVLGPDHPTTGGYPLVAVVIRRDLGAFAARGVGAAVRFEAVDIVEARALARAPVASIAPAPTAR